jgi:hypothetical protein
MVPAQNDLQRMDAQVIRIQGQAMDLPHRVQGGVQIVLLLHRTVTVGNMTTAIACAMAVVGEEGTIAEGTIEIVIGQKGAAHAHQAQGSWQDEAGTLWDQNKNCTITSHQ